MKTKNIFKLLLTLALVFTIKPLKPKAQVLSIPQKYIVPDETTQNKLGKPYDRDMPDGSGRQPGNIWIVFSDRDNNNTFTTPDGNVIKRTLKFLDYFYVTEETETKVKLVKDKNSVTDDWGWIDKKNLLLWRRCVVKPLGKIDLKAMTLNTMESIVGGERDVENVHFFKDPGLKIKTGKTSTIYSIFFVYKKQSGAILLSTKPRINDLNPEKVDISKYLYGWVDEKRLTMWDNRIALEPNWNTEQVKKLKTNNKNLIFFSNKNAVDEYIKTGKTENKKDELMKSSFKNERMIGDDKRFPSLDDKPGTFKSEAAFKVGVMGNVNTEKGEIEKERHAKMERQYNEMRSNLRNINLYFVVDATKSMKDYFMPICRAIEKSMENKDTRYNYRFGATIYRDYDERTENRGLGLIKTEPLNKNQNQVIHFLSNTPADDTKDHDKPEAVYYGLKEALRSGGFSEKETNLIILVGDAGNHFRKDNTTVTDKEIVELLITKRCHFLSFQVNRGFDSAFEDFNSQMETIMNNTSKKIMSDPDIIKNYQNAGKSITVPEIKKLKDIANVTYISNNPFMARNIFPDRERSISPEFLTKHIEGIIKDITDYTEEIITRMKGTFEEGTGIPIAKQATESEMENKGFDYTSAIMFYMKEMGLSEDDVSKISSKSWQLYTKCYTPSYFIVQNDTIPAFKPVLLYQQSDLYKLTIEIEKLLDEQGSEEKVRERIVRVWIEILREHIGHIDEEKIENMDLESIYNYVYGIPGTSKLMKIKLGDFKDESKVSRTQLYEYVTSIKEKLGNLNLIANGAKTEKYRGFMTSEMQYFWIEQDLIP